MSDKNNIKRTFQDYHQGKDFSNGEKNDFNDLLLKKENEFLIKHILFEQLNKFDDFPEQNAISFEKLTHDFYVKLSSRKEERNKSKEFSIEFKNKQVFQKIFRVAAVFIIAFALGFFYNLYFKKTDSTSVRTGTSGYIVKAPLGAKSNVSLPDGTNIWINAGSVIKYSASFNESDRKVELVGEAYFDVAGNEKLPFEVLTPEISITALGTKFNVKAYPEENKIETTLEEGKIKINNTAKHQYSNNLGDGIVLLPNQKATYIKKTNEILVDSPHKRELNHPKIVNVKKGTVYVSKEIDPALYTSWKDELWYIQAEELSSLAVKLERRFNVKIEFEDRNLMSYRFTGSLKNETLEQLLEAIKLSAPIEYSVSQNIVVLKENKKHKKEFNDILKPE